MPKLKQNVVRQLTILFTSYNPNPFLDFKREPDHEFPGIHLVDVYQVMLLLLIMNIIIFIISGVHQVAGYPRPAQ